MIKFITHSDFSTSVTHGTLRGWLRGRWPVIFLVVAAGLVYVAALPAHRVGTWTDDGFYISLARAFAMGKGMHLIHLSGQPATAIVPPGYPLLLSLIALFLPGNIGGFQWISLLFTLASIPLFYRIVSSRLSPHAALATTMLYALNPNVVVASTWVMSEAVFVFFLLLSIILVEKMLAAQPSASWSLVIGAAVATAALPMIRYFGLPVLGAIVLYVLMRERSRQAVVFAAIVGLGILSVTIAFGANAAVQRYGSVANRLLAFLTVGEAAVLGTPGVEPTSIVGSDLGLVAGLLRNTGHLLTSALPDTIVQLFGGPQVTAFFAALGLDFVPIGFQFLTSATVVAGYILCLRQRVSVVEIIVPAYVLFLLIVTEGKWPDMGSSFRYIFPMIPFALLYFLTSVTALDRSVRRQPWLPSVFGGRALLSVLVVASLLVLYLFRDIQSVINPVRNRLPDVSLGAIWLGENTPDDAVVLAETPRVSSIYANRKMVPYPDGLAEADHVFGERSGCAGTKCVDDLIQQYGIDYVFLTYATRPDLPFRWTRFTEQNVAPLVSGDSQRFRLVYASQDGLVRVYQVRELP